MAYLERKRAAGQRAAQIGLVGLRVIGGVIKRLGVRHDRLLLSTWQQHAAGFWARREGQARLERRAKVLVDLAGWLRMDKARQVTAPPKLLGVEPSPGC